MDRSSTRPVVSRVYSQRNLTVVSRAPGIKTAPFVQQVIPGEAAKKVMEDVIYSAITALVQKWIKELHFRDENVTAGAPQESILDSSIFSCFINDLPSII
eukprot:g37841.t1